MTFMVWCKGEGDLLGERRFEVLLFKVPYFIMLPRTGLPLFNSVPIVSLSLKSIPVVNFLEVLDFYTPCLPPFYEVTPIVGTSEEDSL